MARNDGIDRTSARNQCLTEKDIGKIEGHNERENQSYTNPDIDPSRSHLNVHFKTPTSSYAEMFAKMGADGQISTRGLKPDAYHYGEMVFDVNTAYFHNNGGYEYAKQFFAEAYQAAVKIVGGEQYILSAVMHADERNPRMSDALGYPVFHYHLHVVYVPVVEKQIKWTKRCKDPKLVGTVKQTIMQVSASKKWMSDPVLDEQGKPMLNAQGKVILNKSYSVLQDQFYDHMAAAGYTNVQRGEKGSTEEHLTTLQFKTMKEEERLAQAEARREQAEADAAQMEAQRVQAAADASLAHQEAERARAEAEQLERETAEAEDQKLNAVIAARNANERAERANAAADEAEAKAQEVDDAVRKKEHRLNKLTGQVKNVESYVKSLGTPESKLPKPGFLESAASYMTKVLPVLTELFGVIRDLYGQLISERTEKKELRAAYDRKVRDVDYYCRVADEAQDKATRYDKLEKKLGTGEIERLIAEHDAEHRDDRRNKRSQEAR